MLRARQYLDATVERAGPSLDDGRGDGSRFGGRYVGLIPKDATTKQLMARKFKKKAGAALYARRKTIVEPVFGQMSTVQDARQLLLRGKPAARPMGSGTLVEVAGQEQARAVAGIGGLEITIARGRPVVPLPEGDRYLGFLFARGLTAETVEASLRGAPARLPVRIGLSSAPAGAAAGVR